MPNEYETGTRIKLDETAVSVTPGTPAAPTGYEWAFVAGDPDGITMDETMAEANIVPNATALSFTSNAEGAVRGAVKAENATGLARVWYPQANFRNYPDVYTDDFSSYASNAELQAAWEKIAGSGDLFTLSADGRTPSGTAALLDDQATTTSYYRWVAPSNRPNNANFKMYMEIYLDRGANTNDPRDLWVEGRGTGNVQVRYDENNIPTFDYYSILWDLQDGLLRHKTWLKGAAEPGTWVSESVPVQNGDIRIAPKAAGDRRIGYASIAFNGAEPVRPV